MMERTYEEAEKALTNYVRMYQLEKPYRKYIEGTGILPESKDIIVFLRENPPANLQFPESIDGVRIRYCINGIIKPRTNLEAKL